MKREVEKKRPKNKTKGTKNWILNVRDGLWQLISKTILRIIYDSRLDQYFVNGVSHNYVQPPK